MSTASEPDRASPGCAPTAPTAPQVQPAPPAVPPRPVHQAPDAPQAAAAAASGATVVLSSLPLRAPATVVGVDAPAHAAEWADWLAEIGFLPGETVMLTARARPGGDPLVVRVGDSTFALRQAEAACVHVVPRAVTPSAELAR